MVRAATDFGPIAICWSSTHFDLISSLFSAARVPKGLFGPDSFSFVAPLWAELYEHSSSGALIREAVQSQPSSPVWGVSGGVSGSQPA